MNQSFSGTLTQEKADWFFKATVQEENYKEYRWTWCGRYCIPMGLKTSEKLSHLLDETPLNGTIIGYSTSISQKHLSVDRLNMGTTATATARHWVGYPAAGFQ